MIVIPRNKINKAGELIMKIEPAREQVSRAEKSACAQRPPSRVGAGRLVPDGSGWPRVWSAGRARPATDDAAAGWQFSARGTRTC